MSENFFGDRIESPSGRVVIRRSGEKKKPEEEIKPGKELKSEEILKKLQKEAGEFKIQKSQDLTEEKKFTRENIFKG